MLIPQVFHATLLCAANRLWIQRVKNESHAAWLISASNKLVKLFPLRCTLILSSPWVTPWVVTL